MIKSNLGSDVNGAYLRGLIAKDAKINPSAIPTKQTVQKLQVNGSREQESSTRHSGGQPESRKKSGSARCADAYSDWTPDIRFANSGVTDGGSSFYTSSKAGIQANNEFIFTGSHVVARGDESRRA
ncbi:MAG: hypothetical protein HYX63_19170 [Gammaproteobacteria bacterium]|nr:hypothetical protein [Gammaproteobacteria bacterium]